MPRLYRPNSGETLAEITDAQLQFLIDHLEEEGPDDKDYYINRATLDMFREKKCDEGLLKILQDALGDSDDTDIAWE